MNRINTSRLHSIALTGLLLCVPALSHATIRNVPTVYPNIQAAINASVSGDTVLVSPGFYSGPGNFNIDPLGKAITIKSSGGPGSCTLDGNSTVTGFNAHQLFIIHSGETTRTVISGFTLEDGYATYGGAVYISNSSPTFSNCVFAHNYAVYGGGCYATLTSTNTPVFSNCTFDHNTAGNGSVPSWGGGLMIVGGAGTISNSAFVSNTAIFGSSISLGGGLALQADKTRVSNCAFNDNAAYYGGGAQVEANSLASFTNCTFDANNGNGIGGGVDVMGGALPTFTNCTFSNNHGNNGGGLFSYNGAGVKVNGCLFDGNTADYAGAGLGAWTNSGTLAVTNCTFSNNTAANGAGLFTLSTSKNTITDCTFDFNHANGTTSTFFGNGNGGGLWVDNTTATITGCLFTNNNATYGGGAASSGNATFNDCIFRFNVAAVNGGGLLQNTNTLVAVNCLFITNSAVAGGGGILTNGATAIVTECSFSNNRTFGNYGDGIYIEGSSHLTVSDSILWDLNNGNDLRTDGSPMTVQYTDCLDGVEPGIANLSADPMFVDPINGNLILQPFSPCLNGGSTKVPHYSSMDIDSTKRNPLKPSIGAYEN